MICPNCGAETEATTGRCGACETDLSDASTQLGDVGATVTAGNLDLARTVSDAETGADAPADTDAPTRLDDNDNAAETPTLDDAVTASDDDTPAADDSPVLAPGQRFGPRYQVTRLVGEGGMGAVYEAFDNELGVDVALKVIRPEQMGDGRKAAALERRFKRELLLGRKVTHKNVVRIHDIGEIGGIKYITMPYIEGRDLSSVLKEAGGTLPVSRTLKIARSVLSGLTAAHDAGVVHRDMKPANIMIDADDEAYIMDFGIALAVTDTTAATDQGGTQDARPTTRESALLDSRTQLGRVVGTVQYMAPEQGRGETVDKRADLYAFGLILYDMLVGRKEREKTSSSPLEELTGRMKAPPAPVRTIRDDVPEPLADIIGTCVAPDPADRYPHPHALQADLDLLDDDGALRPVERRFSPLQLAALVSAVVAAMAGAFFVFGPREPPPPHDPVSVLIADIQNGTTDPAFDGTLEPILKIALEEAEFISGYDRLAIRRTLGVRPPDVLDETGARALAVNQGLGVVLFGALAPSGSGYELSMSAVEAVSGNVLVTIDDQASDRDQVLSVATELAAEVREALGDDLSDSARRFAQDTLSTTSLDVVAAYAAAMDAYSRESLDDAFQSFSDAVALDPDFGLAYAGMAAVSRNLGRQEDAEDYLNQAISHLDSMTERERYRTRGLFYGVTGDYQACVTEYGDLVARYAGDTASRNNLALCATFLRDWPTALEEMRQLIEMVPGRALYRENRATFLSYAGDFQAGEEAALEESGLYGLLPLAFAQMGQGRLTDARATYAALGEFDSLGASYMASGLADLAMYEGRFADAARLFRDGATADVTDEEPDRAARKLAGLAQAHVLRGEIEQALAVTDEALATSPALRTRFLIARVLVEAGELAGARALAEELAAEFQAEIQAYAKIIEGGAALKDGDPREAITLLTEANGLLDTWLGHFDLGRAFLEAGAFLQAEGEFDRCLARRGEAIALFLDEEPTYGYFPPVHYYQGRVREGLNNAGFAESYRTYLDIREDAGEDPLVPDVRQRVALEP